MAPIQSSLMTDSNGMGGFCYKDLIKSPVGKYIDYFNTQFYFDYSENSYNQVIKNDYDSKKIVMGMVTGQNLEENYNVIKNLYEKYGDNFGGVFFREYCNAPINFDKIIYDLIN